MAKFRGQTILFSPQISNIEIDQQYDPTSEHAQSGKALAPEFNKINTDISVTNKTLFNVTELLKGHEYSLIDGATPIYRQTVPTGAQKYASLGMVGGHSEVISGEIISGKCNKVITQKANTTVIQEFLIPQAIQNLDGYGWSAGTVYNYVDFENKKFHKKVDKYVFTGAETWAYHTAANPYWQCSGTYLGQKQTGKNITSNGIIMSIASNAFRVRLVDNPSITEDTNMNEIFPEGTEINFELAEEVVTDISEYLTDDNYIETETGGTVTFHQTDDTQFELQNKTTYMVRNEDAI